MKAKIGPNITSIQDKNKSMSNIKKQDSQVIPSTFPRNCDEDPLIKSPSYNSINEEEDYLLKKNSMSKPMINNNNLNKLPHIYQNKENIQMNFSGISLPTSHASLHSVKNSFKNDIKKKNNLLKIKNIKKENEDEVIPEEPNPNQIAIDQRRTIRGGLCTIQKQPHEERNGKQSGTLEIKEENNENNLETILEEALFEPKLYKMKNVKRIEEKYSSFQFRQPNSLVSKFMYFDLIKCKKNIETTSFVDTVHTHFSTPNTITHQKNHSVFSVKDALSNLTTAKQSQANLTRKELFRITKNELY